MSQIELHSDGACSGNPGPGGWGAVLTADTLVRKISGYEANTTNNRMELTAVIKGLEALLKPSQVRVTTDSRYVKDAFTAGWLSRWQAQGWKTRKGDPVKNQDLWLVLIRLQRFHVLEWQWVKGHSGHPLNEVCDEIARTAILMKKGVDIKGTWNEVLGFSPRG